jgi:hypothetical protein
LGILYAGVDGNLFSSAAAAAREDTESSARGAAFEAPPGQATPRFYKLEFQTYDGTVYRAQSVRAVFPRPAHPRL